MGFLFQKYDKLSNNSLGCFIKHRVRISEEFCTHEAESTILNLACISHYSMSMHKCIFTSRLFCCVGYMYYFSDKIH